MPSKTKSAGVSQNYQRFAWGTLAIAALVALFSTDRGGSAPSEPLAQPVLADAAPAPAKMSHAAFTPAASAQFAEAEIAGADEAQDGTAGEAAAQPGAAPGNSAGPAQPPTTPPAASAEAGQLVAASRNRSGGVAQGDDPHPSQAQ